MVPTDAERLAVIESKLVDMKEAASINAAATQRQVADLTTEVRRISGRPSWAVLSAITFLASTTGVLATALTFHR